MALRTRVMEIPINQSGFVSNRSESQLQSQARTSLEGPVEQHARAISVIALSNGESRKRGLGLRGSIPMKQRARGIKDPRWISFSSERVLSAWDAVAGRIPILWTETAAKDGVEEDELVDFWAWYGRWLRKELWGKLWMVRSRELAKLANVHKKKKEKKN